MEALDRNYAQHQKSEEETVTSLIKPFSEVTALVTGGAGFIGSAVVDELISVGVNRVAVVDNFFLGKDENLSEAGQKAEDRLSVHRGDVTDRNFLKSVLLTESPVDVVYNLAVKPLMYSFVDPNGVFETSVVGVQNLLELQRDDYFETMVHFSSSEAYGTAQHVPMNEDHVMRPTTPYGAGKAAADHLVISYYVTFGNDVLIIRPFNNYGPRQNDKSYAGVLPTTITRILDGHPPIIFGDGNQTRDLTYVKDTASAAVRAYQVESTRGRIFNLCSGQEIAINELVKSVCRLMKYDGQIRYEKTRAGDVRRLLGDSSLARQVLRFVPSVSLDAGLKSTIAWYERRRLGSI